MPKSHFVLTIRVWFQESCYMVKQRVIHLPLTKSPSLRKQPSHSTSSFSIKSQPKVTTFIQHLWVRSIFIHIYWVITLIIIKVKCSRKWAFYKIITFCEHRCFSPLKDDYIFKDTLLPKYMFLYHHILN